MSQPIIDFTNQALLCLIKLGFIAVDWYHVVYFLALQVVDQCLEVFDGCRIGKRAHTSLVVEESQHDRYSISTVLEPKYRSPTVSPDTNKPETIAAQVTGKIKIRRFKDINCLSRPALYPMWLKH